LNPDSRTERWLTPPENPAVGPHEVHVWRLQLHGSATDRQRWSALLSPDEVARADRFRSASAKDAFVAARAQMRCVLAGYVRESPAALRFSYEKYGKPALAGAPAAPQFSLSHSADLALLAVSSNGPVGVDIEQVREGVEYDAVSDQLFDAAESARLASSSGNDRTAVFFRYWTCKESVLKALGTGFSLPANLCQVDLERGRAVLRGSAVAESLRSWHVRALAPADGYAGAVAAIEAFNVHFWDARGPWRG
jgi:4'-phosphopantetheinyl transferase